jgi:5-oxopent-3-ene-1,2,5-tricarboxylate decarboxylase/2-hydroxyhepta-2,4-diene-1,7-dioate isomerase
MTEFRRIVADGIVVEVTVEGAELVAGDGRRFAVEEVVHLPPVEPTKIICTHLNYRSRLEELGRAMPPGPTYFHKPVSSLNAHGGAVVRPAGCKYLNYEGEIGIVIGRVTRNVRPDEVPEYLRGYTVANDFGLHDFRDTDQNSMLRVKGSDTLGSVGPGVVVGWDFHSKRLQTRVNGRVVQEGTTDEMLWDMHYLVADLARNITLLPGDLILSGTPANSRPVEPGVVVEVEVEGLGLLKNLIVEGPEPTAAGVGAQPTESVEVRSVALGSDYSPLEQPAAV